MISIKFGAFLHFEGGETVSLAVLIKCCNLFYPSLERLDSPVAVTSFMCAITHLCDERSSCQVVAGVQRSVRSRSFE